MGEENNPVQTPLFFNLLAVERYTFHVKHHCEQLRA